MDDYLLFLIIPLIAVVPAIISILIESSVDTLREKSKSIYKNEEEEKKEERAGKNLNFKGFLTYIDNLEIDFQIEEKNSYKMIDILFPEPQLTNTKYKEEIKKIHDLFYKKRDQAVMFCSTYPEEDDAGLYLVQKQYEDIKLLKKWLDELIKELCRLKIEEDDEEIANLANSGIVRAKDLQKYKSHPNLMIDNEFNPDSSFEEEEDLTKKDEIFQRNAHGKKVCLEDMSYYGNTLFSYPEKEWSD